MTVWNTNMADIPQGRPVLLRMTEAPIGWQTGDGATVTLGQRGDRDTGIWTNDGFFADAAAAPMPGAWIFVAWADVPKFDGIA